MAYPTLALGDPYYIVSLGLLAALLALAVVLVATRGRRRWMARAVIVLALLSPLAGCYALLGSACYVGGDCL